jgi:methylenetetrahydrofolate reductase (NADPH)
MPRLSDLLDAGRFVITCEFTPPKGVDLSELRANSQLLAKRVHAVNLTDSHRARMSMSPLGAAKALIESGVPPIVQVTGRDRNRIAVQADLLAAASFGVENVLCMSGDNPAGGDHPDAKGVFDLEALGLLRTVCALNEGSDLGGNALTGVPSLCPGAVANPGAPEIDVELDRLEQKQAAGARFFQTQPVFDIPSFERFVARSDAMGAPIIAGVILLKSAKMAEMLNAVPGIDVPEAVIDRLAKSADRAVTSVEIASETVSALRYLARGVHIMAIGWEKHIPALLDRAGLSDENS